MQKTVLLIGGTGAMGIYLVPELLRLGYKIHITSRREKKSSNENITFFKGDGHDASFIENLCNKYTYNAIVDFMVYTTVEFSSRVDKLLNSTNHYLYLSSYRVFADSIEPITENSPRILDIYDNPEYLKTDEYALTKARQEDILKKSQRKNWTIIRPSITYSKNRYQLGVLEANFTVGRAIRDVPTIIAKEMLPINTTMTWAGDVAKMLALIVGNKNAYGEDYNVVTSEFHTWEEVAKLYKDQIRLDYVPISLADYISITKRKWQVLLDRMYNRRMDNSKVLELTGLKNSDFTSLKDGLEQELKKLDKSLYLNARRNWDMHADIDFITGTRIKEELISPIGQETYRRRINYLIEKNGRGALNMQENFDTLLPHSNQYWKIRKLPWNSFIELVRVKRQAVEVPTVAKDRWTNFTFAEPLQKNVEYQLTMKLRSNKNVTFTPFLHGSGKIVRLDASYLEENNWTTLTFNVAPKYDQIRHFAITASDFKIVGTIVSVDCLKIKRV